jgi:multidrug resistance protein
MLGPFCIDTYLPAFNGISESLGATPVQMQQTLSAYLFGFALMNLFHGALSDALGRRPVVLWGLALFALASAGCALSNSIGQLVFWRVMQGLTTGAGIVVSRAVVRDMYAPADAQRIMSQITLFFGAAPAIAPLVGGLLFVHVNWHAIFWFLTLVGVLLWWANHRWLPETLHVAQRQPFSVANLMRGYRDLGADARFWALALASGVPFNGMFAHRKEVQTASCPPESGLRGRPMPVRRALNWRLGRCLAAGDGCACGNTRQSIAQPAKPHALLLQTQPGLVAIESEVVKNRRLPRRETRQVAACRVGLLAPVQAVGKERRTVHEEGRRAGEATTQLVEDGESVGVDVAPVVQLASMQPLGARQRFPTVACAEDDDGVRRWREGEEVGFVLGDEDTLDG